MSGALKHLLTGATIRDSEEAWRGALCLVCLRFHLPHNIQAILIRYFAEHNVPIVKARNFNELCERYS